MSDGDDELGGGLEAEDDFEKMVNSLNPDEVEEAMAPVETPNPAPAPAEKPKRAGKKRDAKPTVLEEPVSEDLESVMDYDQLPESTRQEMAAGRAALLAKVAR